jgi:hypothetical protein
MWQSGRKTPRAWSRGCREPCYPSQPGSDTQSRRWQAIGVTLVAWKQPRLMQSAAISLHASGSALADLSL